MTNQIKHTPGPWDIGSEGRAATVTRKCHNTDRQEICTVYNAGVALREGYDNEFAANACLIAAAPDLLAALEEALRDTTLILRNSGYSEQAIKEDAKLCHYRAAIAKATGKEG